MRRPLRQLSLLALVVSLLLGASTVSVTNDNMRSRRNEQDRTLQAAVNSETGLIASGVRQTTTALSLLLVNPAVRDLFTQRPPSSSVRRSDIANTALALATVQRSSFVPLSAACLDGREGRQLVCGPTARPARFSPQLGRGFASLAASSAIGAASGAFLSPVSNQFSVAFLAPFRARGRLLGLVHLDINIADTQGSTLIVNHAPGFDIQLASYEKGHLMLDSPSSPVAATSLGSQASLSAGTFRIGSTPQFTFEEGHRAMVAALPLTVGGAHLHVAVVAHAVAANPDFLNAWSPGMLSVLGLSFLMLFGSIAGLALSNRRVTRELSTDPLTGVRNRRALMEDLPRVCQRASEEEPAFLWFFDLNGFKRYNDSFGHVAGDALLARLGDRLRAAMESVGVVYRLGGDEFCVLIAADVSDPHALFQEAREALTEHGGAFTVNASAGAVEIPRETSEPTQALRLADQHMYREKIGSRDGAAELITSVLHAALAQRHPDLGEHSDDVAGDVEMLARTMGLDEDTIDLVVKAGELHDVGKLGIPDEIITKPGPLTAKEWQFMKQHTVMGEQIIAAAGPSLTRMGPLVRASHERWDGNGYPDGLAGREIPLGARIITICDSFRAMLDHRVYKSAMSVSDALAELRRCAGSQFDPELVETFCRLVAERTEPDRLRSAAG
jgi:diguanylate cyclase (GGDEF)-like protein